MHTKCISPNQVHKWLIEFRAPPTTTSQMGLPQSPLQCTLAQRHGCKVSQFSCLWGGWAAFDWSCDCEPQSRHSFAPQFDQCESTHGLVTVVPIMCFSDRLKPTIHVGLVMECAKALSPEQDDSLCHFWEQHSNVCDTVPIKLPRLWAPPTRTRLPTQWQLLVPLDNEEAEDVANKSSATFLVD